MPQVRAAVVSVAAGIGVLVFKFTAYLLTGSVAILSDAAESVVNVVAANIALISLVVAVRPPDRGHPYGHGKAEYLSSATEGWLILLAGGWTFFTAAQRFVRPLPLRNLETGLLVLAVATLANYLTARFLLRVSREAQSIALEADARHLLVDVITTFGVFAGLGLVRFTGIQRLDAVVGVLIGLHILSMGFGIIRRSVGGLMDTNLPPDEESKVRVILGDHKEEIVSYHGLRSRQAGSDRFIDLHLVLHRTLSVGEAHTMCDDLEDHIREALPGADITIHVEPCGPDCRRCAAILAARL
ncbi:MAG TPA: cation diffusion facilitator family transporter [bacterium]|nr:cation diffusion facilitator family transporter [bacterium]